MLAWILTCLGLDPSYIIGGVSRNLGSNAHAGQGDHFVIEADEYDRMFLGLQPIAWPSITYLEHDHPDCFPTMDDYREAFEQFVGRIQPGGTLITCGDQRETFDLAFAVPQGVEAVTYGLDTPAHYRISDALPNELGGFSGTVFHQGALLAELDLQVPGRTTSANALAALAAAHRLGLDMPAVSAALNGRIQGTGRRFEIIGEASWDHDHR